MKAVMASPVVLMLFLYLLPLSTCFSLRSDAALEDAGLIQQVCKATKYYDACVSTLSSDPASFNADRYQLTNISLQNSLDYASVSFQIISIMLNGTSDPKLKKSLDTCVRDYSSAVGALRKAIQSLASKKYHDLHVEVGAASYEAAACEEAFDKSFPPEFRYLLTERNTVTWELCQISIDIALLLEK